MPVLKYPTFSEDADSLLKRNLDLKIWKQLRTLKTSFGGKIVHAVMAGVQDPSLKIGIYATDREAYTK